MKKITLILVALAIMVALALTSEMSPEVAQDYVLHQKVIVELVGDGYKTVYVDHDIFEADPKLQEALEVLETKDNWVVVINYQAEP